ncbi:hypothetical protein [Bdellovibrio svalbardensis]|uniref:Uncharacterized protein n=1 Tax=Bdellovibrio svalbardensis TaxID=2972972 RepID=A0ABT6DPW2_9BACT|nr:hypothetical protein [Bdellovibrio svalbardensis]MDG0817876.1 hypothetical protein [Bdellovibrio svalbardensis]
MKFFLACLILTFIALKFEFKNSESSLDLSSHAPTTSAASREGNYFLVNGTQGCPTSVIWFEQCAGFVLNPRTGSKELPTEKFCHVNRGLRVVSESGLKVMTQVETKERYVRKSETSIQNGVSSSNEDTLIFDDTKEQFLWEHSQNRNSLNSGFSCLYSK